MTSRNSRLAVQGLRWVLGIVVLWQSCLLLRGTIADMQATGSGHIGPHAWVRLSAGHHRDHRGRDVLGAGD